MGGSDVRADRFVSHHRVKPGMLDQLKSLTREIWATVEMEKPQTLMNLADLNQDGTEVTYARFRRHRGHVAPRAGSGRPNRQAYVYIDPIALEIYGPAEERSSARCAPKRQVLAQR